MLAVKAYNEFVSEMGGNPTVASLLVFLGIGMLLIQKGIVERRQFQMESAPLTISGWRAKLATTCVLAVVGLSLLPTLVVTVTATYSLLLLLTIFIPLALDRWALHLKIGAIE
ncbi:hypothetical protein BKK81_29230 [Cupriavidus sp. USMAHM13]|nr:hypothetical protein BKK81_29230 [Cupriavidus sp. USMAHM13]